MEKLKDFFYDKNDIVVALVIILIAGLLIYGRVGAIMDYPQVAAAAAAQQGDSASGTDAEDPANAGTDAEDPSGSGTDAGDSGTATGGDDVTQNPGVTPPTTPDVTTPPVTPPTPPVTPPKAPVTPPANSGSSTVVIPSGSTGEKIAQILLDAGVITSKTDFTAAVSAAKADTKLKAGTFKIPTGSTLSEVVSIITK